MYGVVLADTDSFVVTVFLQKESDMEWWKQIAEGEPDIDTSKVPLVKLLVGAIKLLVWLVCPRHARRTGAAASVGCRRRVSTTVLPE